MGGDSDAPVDVADDEIAVLVFFAHGLGVDGGDALLVQHMGLGPAVDPGDAGGPGVVAELVHVGGIHGVHFSAEFFAQLIGQHHP